MAGHPSQPDPEGPPLAVPAIVLAAGASRRLGRPKQRVRWAGETLLRRAVRAALGGCSPVLVVVGCRGEEMAAELAGLPVTVVANPQWEDGMASSIRAGIRALPPSVPAALFLVCDQPEVDQDLVARLVQAHRSSPGSVVACGYGGGKGIPALFPARWLPRLLTLKGDQGARGLLADEGVVVVPFPGGERDVDRPEDLPQEDG
jgi:molybdenum cofactor cytidylyltransferase